MLRRTDFQGPSGNWKRVRNRRPKTRAILAFLSAAILVPCQLTAAVPSIQNPVAESATASRPALWVVSDHDTVIFLFGTFHALDERTSWFGHSVKAAFDASDELVLETLVPEDPNELISVLSRHTVIGPVVPGAPVISTAPGGSFAAAAGEAMKESQKLGMSIDKGADATLRRAALANGKAVGGLERFEEQLMMFRSLQLPAQSARAQDPRANPPAAIAQTLQNMQAAWHRGDSSGFAAMLATIEAQSPVTYRTLFADRNAQWASWIAERLKRPGTVFVAVGTGHLIGRDSVQNNLARRGIATARVS